MLCFCSVSLPSIAETPAKHMMTIIQAVQAGETPPMSIVVAVQQALERSADVYTPANQDLKSKLKQATDLDVSVCMHDMHTCDDNACSMCS